MFKSKHDANAVVKATEMEVASCPEGHFHVTLFDVNGRPFASGVWGSDTAINSLETILSSLRSMALCATGKCTVH